jgi:hypothetical protein
MNKPAPTPQYNNGATGHDITRGKIILIFVSVSGHSGREFKGGWEVSN